MKTVELVPGIRSSALGFGCAPILGSINAKKSRRAIEYAIECGINHFDLARSYGYGTAEAFVGKIIKHKRDKIVLVSKFGIKATWQSQLLRPLKPLVRFAKNKLNQPGHPAKETKDSFSVSISNKFLYRIPFTIREMQKSLEQSLRALNTDYLDYFFLHEPSESLTNYDEIVEAYTALKAQGKIRASGIAYMRNQELLHHNYINDFDVLQFNNSPGAHGYKESVVKRGLKSNVLFSPLRNGFKEMEPVEKISTLISDFPNSVILCSMFNEKHIKQNSDLLNQKFEILFPNE